MSTDLGERLDTMAEIAVGHLTLEHPAQPSATISSTRSGPSPMALALAACSLLVFVIGAAMWLQRDQTEVDTAGPLVSQPIPALLLEEPTPIEDLPTWLQEPFDENSVRGPLSELDPELDQLVFAGAHVVSRDGVTVAVGLDETGRFLCTAETFDGEDGSASGCGSPANFMSGRASWGSYSAGERSVVVVLVPDGVSSIEVGTETAEVERNIAIFDGSMNDVLVLRYADGSTEPALSIPDPSAKGELVIDDGPAVDILSVGCSIVGESFLLESSFSSNDSLVSATVTPNGLALTGGLGGDTFEMIDRDAVIEPTVEDGLFSVNASWKTETSSGTLRIECGDRLLDLSDIR